MKELISQGVPSKQDNDKTNDVPQEAQTETVQVEKPTPRKRKGGSGNYRETYFQKVELTDRQPLYVSRTTHEKLMRIVTVIGGRKVTVSSYVENILLRHFEQYQDEINTLYESLSDYGNPLHTYRAFGVLTISPYGCGIATRTAGVLEKKRPTSLFPKIRKKVTH